MVPYRVRSAPHDALFCFDNPSRCRRTPLNHLLLSVDIMETVLGLSSAAKGGEEYIRGVSYQCTNASRTLSEDPDDEPEESETSQDAGAAASAAGGVIDHEEKLQLHPSSRSHHEESRSKGNPSAAVVKGPTSAKPSETGRLLATMRASAYHLLDVINDILDISKVFFLVFLVSRIRSHGECYIL